MSYTMTESDAEELARVADYLPQFVIDRVLDEWDCETFDVALVLEGAFIGEYDQLLQRAETTYSEAYGGDVVALTPIVYDDVEESMDLRLKGSDLPWVSYYVDTPVEPHTEMTVADWRVAVQCAVDRYNADYQERALAS